jgi:two-component system KDP operon response regulator KdpE
MNEHAPIVLVVDDEVQIRRFLRTGFELNGFVVHEASTGTEAIRAATLRPVDLVIIDLGLPDMDGADVIERIRSWSAVPIIVLSVRSTEPQKVRLLELGADDYVVKPFGMAELLARVRVVLRRQMRTVSGEPTIKIGPLTVDLAARAVLLNDRRLALTPKEYRLLQVLAQHAGNVVTHQHLLKEVWGSIDVHATHYLRIFVRKLRQKIEPHPDSPRILVTELGVGYRLAPATHENDAAAEPAKDPAPTPQNGAGQAGLQAPWSGPEPPFPRQFSSAPP